MFDNHVFDSEFVTVRVMEDDLIFDSMFFSQHGGGVWTKDVQYMNGKPVVFIAKGSHSNWPTKGKHVRYLGFGNDHCTSITDPEKWPVFNPNLVLLSSEFQYPFPTMNYEFMSFVGSLSQDFGSNITCYDMRKICSLSYKNDLGSENSEVLMQTKVKFDIKLVLMSIVYIISLVIVILFLCFKNGHVDVDICRSILIFIVGFVFAYMRLFP